MLLESIERNHVEGSLVARGQHHGCRHAVAMGSQPVGRSDAPAIARYEAGKVVLRHGSAEVVADATLMIEELLGHHRADGVAAMVPLVGLA